MIIDELKDYLPKFLSSGSERDLFEGLKDFPNNLDSRIYTSALKHSPIIFQGDGMREMQVINLPDETIKKANSIVISNTCDIDSFNKRSFPSQIIYAPIFNLSKYYETLLKNSKGGKSKIDEHIKAIKKQRITQIFYLPEINGVIEESLVFLDRLNNCKRDYIKDNNITAQRLFTLSDFGAYLFVLKLSIHFSRIQDKVDRKEGEMN